MFSLPERTGLLRGRVRGLKVGGIEAFGEPTVYVGKQSACFVVPALSFAEARQTRGCSEFQGFAQLVLRGSNRLTEPVLSPLLMRPEQRKFAVEAQQFGLLTKLIAPLGKGQALISASLASSGRPA